MDRRQQLLWLDGWAYDFVTVVMRDGRYVYEDAILAFYHVEEEAFLDAIEEGIASGKVALLTTNPRSH